MSCALLLISTWPGKAEGKGALIRPQSLQHTSHGDPVEKTASFSYRTLPLSPGPSQKGLTSLSLSLSLSHTHTHTHNMCSWAHKSFHTLGLSDSCLFAHLFLGVCGCGCHSNTQGQGPLSKLAHFNSCPSSCLLLGLVGVVPKRLAFLKAGAAGAAARASPLFSQSLQLNFKFSVFNNFLRSL